MAGADEALRAHHRVMREIATTSLGGEKVSPRPDEYDAVSRVFVRAGGSWERLFLGSIPDMQRLKRVMRVAAKHGYFTKTPVWTE